jgi:hypothetical protein
MRMIMFSKNFTISSYFKMSKQNSKFFERTQEGWIMSPLPDYVETLTGYNLST